MDGGTKDCSYCLSHVTKMVVTPTYDKNTLKNILSRNRKADDHRTGYVALEMKGLQNCSNEDSRLNLAYLRSRSNLLTNAL